MLDYRMETFLTLCQTMNYRLTAEQLNMTQPAVTQHIHFLERSYGCKLFTYENRHLEKTAAAVTLETYGRGAAYNAEKIRVAMGRAIEPPLRLGATKTIGDYVIAPQLVTLLQGGGELSLVVDNTHNLLRALDSMELDITLIEGYFDKSAYDSQLMKQEHLVGICGKNHPFSGKTVTMEDLFSQRLILREPGSGTRAVFEEMLHAQNFGLEAFSQVACISSFEVTKTLVRAGCGISFVYESIVHSDPALSTFAVEDCQVVHEFNYVYLKGTHGNKLAEKIQGFTSQVHHGMMEETR